MPTFALYVVEEREYAVSVEAATLEEAQARAFAAWDASDGFEEVDGVVCTDVRWVGSGEFAGYEGLAGREKPKAAYLAFTADEGPFYVSFVEREGN